MKLPSGRQVCRRAPLIAALLGLVFVPARPQEKDGEVKFTVHTEMVLIPTVVTGKSGKHVEGLKKEDFMVLEDGAEQKVSTFEEISSSAQHPVRTEMPDAFSNSVGAEGSTRRITVIVLDFINTRITDQANARTELMKYLTESVDAREPTGLYTLTPSGIQVVHDFTTDPGILVAALHEVNGDPTGLAEKDGDTGDSGGGGSGGGSSGGRGSGGHGSKGSSRAAVKSEAGKLQSLMNDAEMNLQAFEQRMAITYTLEGMQQIAQALGGLPGRKSVIWASGGFPFTVTGDSAGITGMGTGVKSPSGRDSLSDVLPLYERTWQLLNNAEIALYPVDVKGLKTSPGLSATRSGSGTTHNPRNSNLSRSSTSLKQMDTQSTFQAFAAMTGGRAYYNSNDLVRGFRDAVEDSSQYYMIGYYLDPSKTKSGWRKLTVKLNHEHGEVRTRNGFFVTNATVDPESSRNSDLATALGSPLDFTALPLLAHWNKTEDGKELGTKHVTYTMHLLPDPKVINDADNNHLVLDFVAMAVTPEGKPAGPPVGQKLDIHLAAERATLIRQKGALYTGGMDLAPGEYTVRFVVRDDLSGRTGSVSGPLKVQ
jgi:VWFA-related protein